MLEPQVSTKKPMAKGRRLIWGALILVLVGGGVGWILFHPKPQTVAGGPPGRGGRAAFSGPMPVVAVPVVKSDLDVTLNALGTVTPLATVTVKTQIAGQLVQIAFHEGQLVKKGDFLAQIDPRPYQAQLDQYQGQLERDQALLKQAELDLVRYRTLLAEDSIASQQVDSQVSLVEQYRGTVATDRALVDNARLNVAYCHIVSPIDGRVGLRQVDLGNYLQPSDSSGIVVITQMQPMSVVFTLPEDQLPLVLREVNKGQSLTVAAFDRAKTQKLAAGKLDTIDNEIDPTTGTVKMRAMFANQPEILFPQQFVNIELLVYTLHDAKSVPSAAVQNGAPGTYVYLVKADNTVTVRPIKTGPQSGDHVAVLSGLDIGDKVVIDGADKLREGASVTLPADTATPAGGQAGTQTGAPGGDMPREHRHRDKDAAPPASKPQ